jgi:hypothetical protein
MFPDQATPARQIEPRPLDSLLAEQHGRLPNQVPVWFLGHFQDVSILARLAFVNWRQPEVLPSGSFRRLPDHGC